MKGPFSRRNLFGLAPGGVYQAVRSPATLVSSYLSRHTLRREPRFAGAPFHPFPVTPGWFPFLWHFPSPAAGRLRVTEHLALWSSDFPPLSCRNTKGRLPVLLRQSIMKFYHYIIFYEIKKGIVYLKNYKAAIILQLRTGYGGTEGTAGHLDFS